MTRQHPRAYIRALSLEETRRRVEHATTPAAARVEALPRKVLPATLHGVLVAISAHQFDAAGVCWASHYTLALEAQCSVRTVQRALRWAELLGLVVVVEAPHGGRAKGETHGYRVVRVEGAPTSKDWSKWDRGRREKWLARKLKGGPEELAARAKARAEVMRERVERERERMAFRSATWHDVVAQLSMDGSVFDAQLVMLEVPESSRVKKKMLKPFVNSQLSITLIFDTQNWNNQLNCLI